MGDFIAVCAKKNDIFLNTYETVVRGIQRPYENKANLFGFAYNDSIQGTLSCICDNRNGYEFEGKVCKQFNITTDNCLQRRDSFPQLRIALAVRSVVSEQIQRTENHVPMRLFPSGEVVCYLDGEIKRRDVHILFNHLSKKYSIQEIAQLSDIEFFTLIFQALLMQQMTPEKALRRLLNLVDGEYIATCIFKDHPEEIWIANRNQQFYFGKNQQGTYITISNQQSMLEGVESENIISTYKNRILRIDTQLRWKYDKLPFLL